MALLRGVSFKHHGGFYCLHFLCYFTTENMLESHESEFENLGFFNVIMSSEDIEILEFNQYQKSDKTPFII